MQWSYSDIELPTDHETLGGFVLQELGHVPEEGERFTYDHLRFEIEEMERNRIIRMTITIKDEETDESCISLLTGYR